ncbi:hypothetical protein MHU86_5407 [Fragilaria crotonensis]|nr:hypothetical protein MHU86_5407 [Fragilaria crotonensis]
MAKTSLILRVSADGLESLSRAPRHKKLTVITAYRVCSGSIRSAPLGSSFAREYNYFHLSTKQSVNPRRLFLRDLQQQVLQLQEQGHAIIVMMDVNSTLQSDTHFADFLDHCTLFDLHANDPAESTYIGAESRRIDFILGCHHARQFLERSGTLSYNEGPQSDHRGLYVDLKLDFFQRSSAISLPSSRTVHTGNPELVAKYNDKVVEYYTAHRMVERINDLHNNYHSMSRDDIRARLVGWDNDKGRAMKAAENVLKRPPKKCRWSPILRNKAFTRLYWKLRLRELQEGKITLQHSHDGKVSSDSTIKTFSSPFSMRNYLSKKSVRSLIKRRQSFTNVKLMPRQCG